MLRLGGLVQGVGQRHGAFGIDAGFAGRGEDLEHQGLDRLGGDDREVVGLAGVEPLADHLGDVAGLLHAPCQDRELDRVAVEGRERRDREFQLAAMLGLQGLHLQEEFLVDLRLRALAVAQLLLRPFDDGVALGRQSLDRR